MDFRGVFNGRSFDSPGDVAARLASVVLEWNVSTTTLWSRVPRPGEGGRVAPSSPVDVQTLHISPVASSWDPRRIRHEHKKKIILVTKVNKKNKKIQKKEKPYNKPERGRRTDTAGDEDEERHQEEVCGWNVSMSVRMTDYWCRVILISSGWFAGCDVAQVFWGNSFQMSTTRRRVTGKLTVCSAPFLII